MSALGVEHDVELNIVCIDQSPSQHNDPIDNTQIFQCGDPSEPKPPHKCYKYLHFPSFTIFVSVVDLAMLIACLASGGFVSPSMNPMLGPSVETLLRFGAKYTPLITQKGQWWRLIAPTYLHAGVIHLISNLLTQLFFGWFLETKYGTIRFAIIYIGSGVGGILTSAIFIPTLVSVGASGAIFGILALWTVDVLQNLKKTKTKCKRTINLIGLTLTIVISFGLGLLPLVDNFAHIGGYLFGLELSLVLILNRKYDTVWKRNLAIVITILCVLLLIGNFVGFFMMLYFGDIEKYCSWCHYLNCIPRIVDGVDWCG